MRLSYVLLVTKSSRYGINIYVVTDAETAFVLKAIIYTGNYTYSNNGNTDMLNTVKFVCEMCKPFEWFALYCFGWSVLHFHYFDKIIRISFTLCE